jgi:hypothetical protein
VVSQNDFLNNFNIFRSISASLRSSENIFFPSLGGKRTPKRPVALSRIAPGNHPTDVQFMLIVDYDRFNSLFHNWSLKFNRN